MIVVSDTSPVSYLVMIGHVDVLPALFGEVVVPPVVLEELARMGTPEPVREWAAHPPSWLRCEQPSASIRLEGIDPGEAQAISLAKQIGAGLVLIDDARARRAAEMLGLHVRGTLAVLARAGEARLLDLASALDRLEATNFRAPKARIAELREMARAWRGR